MNASPVTISSALPSWRSTSTRDAIERLVTQAVDGPRSVSAEERVAVFDNDGTLWTEKPMQTQLHYVVEQWAAAVKADPTLADIEPYHSAASGELGWLGRAIEKHYNGDDSDLTVLVTALVKLSAGMSVEAYEASVADFYRTAQHLALKRPYSTAVYQPMVELLRYLESNGFTCYIVSGGERDFMRPMTQDYYGIPPERVIGSAYGLEYDEDTAEVRYTSSLAYFDDGPQKPVRIWSRIGRRPLLAVGNSNGDLPMLDFTARGDGGLALLIHHDDDTGRGDEPYDGGAELALNSASARGTVVVSVKNDWSEIFVGGTDQLSTDEPS